MPNRNQPKTPLILGFDGTTLDSSLARHLSGINPAGILLFKRNIKTVRQVKQLLADLKDLLGDLIISIDHEGGIVNRFPPDFPVPPSPGALRHGNSDDLISKACRYQAELLSHLGFNLNFAPVLDLDLDRDNEVIGTRSFSTDPLETAKYGRICIKEHALQGIATTAKHFPTHGRTSTDSHFATGSVIHENRSLLEDDLLPFREAVKEGVQAVMTAHLTYPILDKEYPATLSKKILNDLLRKELDFSGLIISDCLEMDGISMDYGPETMIMKGQEAGVDLFISSFSLIKERGFQEKLGDLLNEKSGERSDMRKESCKRIDHFHDHYSQSPEKTSPLPDIEEVLEVHRLTLEKKSSSAVPGNHKGFYLVELANRKREGFNADTAESLVSKLIGEECNAVVKSELVYQNEEQRFQEVLRECNVRHLTCVLLTRNGFRDHGYDRFVKFLNTAKLSIHIALLDPADLQGGSPTEWATRGYNSSTCRLLARELNRWG
jgi:beta-N-acetylhexosaminidase